MNFKADIRQLQSFQLQPAFITVVGALAEQGWTSTTVDFFLSVDFECAAMLHTLTTNIVRSYMCGVDCKFLCNRIGPATPHIPLFDLCVVRVEDIQRYAPIQLQPKISSKIFLKDVANRLNDDICMSEEFIKYTDTDSCLTFYFPFLGDHLNNTLIYTLCSQLPTTLRDKILISHKNPPANAKALYALKLQHHVGDNETIRFIKKVPGHTGSDGQKREYCIFSEQTHKRIRCYKTREEAEKALRDMHKFKNS